LDSSIKRFLLLVLGCEEEEGSDDDEEEAEDKVLVEEEEEIACFVKWLLYRAKFKVSGVRKSCP